MKLQIVMQIMVKEEIKAVKVAEINRVVDIEEADQVKEVKEAVQFFKKCEKLLGRRKLIVDCCGSHGLIAALFVVNAVGSMMVHATGIMAWQRVDGGTGDEAERRVQLGAERATRGSNQKWWTIVDYGWPSGHGNNSAWPA